MRTAIIHFISTSTIIAMLSFSGHAEVIDEIEKTFDVETNTTFSLDNVNGSVEISGWDQPTIRVIATIIADSQEDRDNIALDMHQSALGVKVKTRYKEQGRWRHNNNSGKVEYRVSVPKSTALSAIELVNGSLKIAHVTGEVNAQLVNGSIKAKGLAANGEFSSVNGSIKVSYSEQAKALERIDLETVNGSIKLSMPKSLSARVEAETMHGSIKTDFGLVAEKNLFSGRHLSGEFAGGDVRVTMESVNGSIKLLSH
ncbi:MAG: DUF4097 family beta strand repeat-containing protein [Cognaticolwellia sp.]